LGAGDTFDVQTTYFDIDLNAHVTSSRYIDWMMDTFESSFHKENYPTELSINFLRETKPGHSIRLTRQASDEQTPKEHTPNDQSMDDQVFQF
jgi:acyl-ACP thioesterase